MSTSKSISISHALTFSVCGQLFYLSEMMFTSQSYNS